MPPLPPKGLEDVLPEDLKQLEQVLDVIQGPSSEDRKDLAEFNIILERGESDGNPEKFVMSLVPTITTSTPGVLAISKAFDTPVGVSIMTTISMFALTVWR